MSTEAARRRRPAQLLAGLALTSQVAAIAALLGVSSIASTSALAVGQAGRDHGVLEAKRHGDADEDGFGIHSAATTSHGSHPHGELADDSAAAPHPHGHDGHDGHDSHDSHDMHGASFYDVIPDPLLQTSATFIPVPALPLGAGGHSHGGHGAEEPKLELNETVIVRWKGPDPLSYIEWDFGYGVGKSDDLLRFSQAYKQGAANVMGVSGERWRTLVDERDEETRMQVASDVLHRVQASHQDPGRHGALLILHVVGCILSCFVALPIALALHAAESSLAPLASLVYLVSLGASLVMSQLYRAMTPRLYPSNAHGGLGYAIFWISLVVLGRDVLRLLVQMAKTVRAVQGKSKKWSVKTVVSALSPPPVESYDAVEEERMLSAQDGDSDGQETETESRRGSKSPHRVHFAQEQPTDAHGVWPHGASSHHGPGDQPSPSSTLCNTPRMPIFGDLHQSSQAWKALGGSGTDERVASWRRFDDHPGAPTKKAKPGRRATATQLLRSIVRYSLVTVARSLPVLSFAAAYTGLAVYTGSCRGPYGNTCMAHGIKGGIFFWYGLLSFARYLGAYADLGWAWNRQPSASRKGEPTAVSAEFVECLVIFIYGATNTWMERFGAAPGDPYSVKQVQHISIAVMFWFAGLMGLILEMRAFKKLLALPVALKQAQLAEEHDGGQSSMVTCQEALDTPSPPPSYSASFNPFPALVIGVTGVAMAAHHQDYVYEVSIHALWGNLLAGFSILRILTYFFLWLRPPTSSIMPSRPPTEALASFSLACGGLVFMLSSEEVSFVAMRNGFGDFMMILNVTVAIVSLVFCCIAGLMILKAYAVQREKQRGEARSQLDEEQRHPSPSISPVFVLEDDEGQDEKRQLSSSPVNI